MKKSVVFAMLLMATGCDGPSEQSQASQNSPTSKPEAAAKANAAASAIPYSLTLEGFAIEGFPGLHSAAIAGAPEKLVIIGGRRNGLHGFPVNSTAGQAPAFPKTEANDTIYVLDLKNRKLLGSAQVGSLPPKVVKQFMATNTEYELLNGWFYIIGGYASDPQTGSFSTLGYITVVNFDALTDAVINKQPLDDAFASANIVQFDHLALAITGGALELLPDASGATDFVLAFGQQFDGEYTTSGGLVNQTYSDGVRLFQFTYPANSAKPSDLKFLKAVPNPSGTPMDPENPYHRRDYTLLPSLDAAGKRRLVAYGGVFKGGRIEGFLNPVFIASGSSTVTLTPNIQTIQLLSQYDTAAIQLFDNRGGSGTIYTTFFGGISQYYWDDATKSLKRDPLNLNKTDAKDGLPFINSISTLKTPTSNDTGIQYLHTGESFPPTSAVPTCASANGNASAPYGGTESKFIIASGMPLATPGVLQLSSITGTSVVGYMVGGIASTAPYPNGATCASGMFYQVTLYPAQPTSTVQLQAPPQAPTAQ
jgi:hypothetical protein